MPSSADISRRVRLLRRALDLGLLLEEEVVPTGGHADETLSEERLAEIFDDLVARGRLDPARLATAAGTERDRAENPSLDRVAYLAPPEPDSTLMLADFPLPRGDRYLPLAYLGDGGMGRVFKAWDQQLRRVVALKFLKRDDPAAVQRFLHEARSQAQLDHPNVCRVYSVGQSHGQAFLAMQFVEGPTLRTALPQLNLEQIAAVARDVAEALHACHRLGILHRDIKLSNIMLERTDRLGWHPYLMDFGLARELAADGETVSGVIVGTPVYASPEQVQGRSEDLDRRSDVYSLGATMYECLCGAPPFPFGGSLADLARRIVEQEPPDPRKRVPNLPADLVTIVLKCLEKDPGRRYDSARALAEDLQRYLDGDPIKARGAGLGYRTLKRIRKNRVLAAVVAASLVTIGVLAAWGGRLVLRARLQAQYAQRLARETERLHGRLALAYALPMHDIRPDRTRMEDLLASIRLELRTQGDWAQAPGRLSLGQGLLALDRLEEARTELEEARRRAPRDPEVARALGLTLARIYGEEMEGLRGRAREEKRRELEPTLLGPAADLLRTARAGGLEAPELAEGVLALVEDRTEDAIRLAREAHSRFPWSWEALLLEADAHKTQASLRLAQGDHAGAEQALQRAGDSLARAKDIARSAPRPYESEAQRRFLRMAIRFDRNSATAADRDYALEGIAEALGVDPANARVLGFKAAIHRRWALTRAAAGEDPRPELQVAAEACEAGLKARPSDVAMINNLASILRNQADWEMGRGIDPGPNLDRAVASLEGALAQPRHADLLWNNLGNCHALRGRWQLAHGLDPSAELERASECLSKAAAVRPWVGHASSRGSVLLDLATFRAWQGQDSRKVLDASLAAFQEALRLNPNSHQSHEGMAEALLMRAEASIALGQPLGTDLETALEHLDRALSVNAQSATARWRRVHGWSLRARIRGTAEDLQRAASAVRPGPGDGPEALWAGAQALWAFARAGGEAARLQALAQVRSAGSRQAWDGRYPYLEGRVLLLLHRRAEAQRALDRAAALNANLRAAALAAAAAG